MNFLFPVPSVPVGLRALAGVLCATATLAIVGGTYWLSAGLERPPLTLDPVRSAPQFHLYRYIRDDDGRWRSETILYVRGRSIVWSIDPILGGAPFLEGRLPERVLGELCKLFGEKSQRLEPIDDPDELDELEVCQAVWSSMRDMGAQIESLSPSFGDLERALRRAVPREGTPFEGVPQPRDFRRPRVWGFGY